MDKPAQNEGTIHRLPQSVIDKISAGEVIQSPYNAVKELIENSIDANSTRISIIAVDAGIKLLKISDNGTGIKKEDFLLLCQRFATSKLQKFEDLYGINTLGFRGEALASISHISNVSVVSRYRDYEFAYSAKYKDGLMINNSKKLGSDPQICAGNFGTTITIEEMFFNNPVRRGIFSNVREEYNKICNIVGRFAIHYSNKVYFDCRNSVSSQSDIKSNENDDCIKIIQSIYKFKNAANLKEYNFSMPCHSASIKGIASNASFFIKKFMFILFINDRLVDCNSLKLALSSVYSEHLPREQYPFVYMSMVIDPLQLDVNVHPSKQEVIFTNQEAVINTIQVLFREFLRNSDSMSVPTINDRQITMEHALAQKEDYSETSLQASLTLPSSTFKIFKQSPQFTVRTDPYEQSIESFILSKSVNNSTSANHSILNESVSLNSQKVFALSITKTTRVLPLTSVDNLKQLIYNNKDEQLNNIFKKFTFVGPIDHSKFMIQNNLNLYMINSFQFLYELFYQIIIFNFGSFNYWKLNPPFKICSQINGKENHHETNKIFLKSEMLLDYFSIEIDSNKNLISIPQLCRKYPIKPCLIQPFTCKLLSNVCWTDEQNCLNDISKHIAWLYSTNISNYKDSDVTTLRKFYQNDILPLARSIFIAQKNMLYDGTVVCITTLPELYKIFERC